MIKAVRDTNVIVSGVMIEPGNQAKIIETVEKRKNLVLHYQKLK